MSDLIWNGAYKLRPMSESWCEDHSRELFTGRAPRRSSHDASDASYGLPLVANISGLLTATDTKNLKAAGGGVIFKAILAHSGQVSR